MNYRLIALDLDGTLLNSSKTISPRTRAALREARARGITTVIATGRSIGSALDWSREACAGPVICCNGAAVLDESGETILTRPIPPAPLERVLRLCREGRLLVECYTAHSILLDRPWAQIRAYFKWVRPRLSSHVALGSLVRAWLVNRIRPVRSLAASAAKGRLPPILKLSILGPDGELARLTGAIRREMPGLEISSSGPDNLEITAAGVSKGSALELLAARLRIPRAAVVALGDSENDVAMLRYAGLGVAMGNANEAARAAADRVAPTCDEDGVAHVIEELMGELCQ
ncbi:MAG TPA: Cof-type HAD-IIB family hydrolase [Symbiobacteriaceae bacterium]